MRPDEYAALRIRAGIRDTFWSRYRWLAEFVFWAFWAGLAFWVYPKIVVDRVVPPQWLVLPLLGGSMALVWVAWLLFRRQQARPKDPADERRARYAADLRARKVDEWRLRLVDAVDIDVDKGAGVEFYLELEDGRVLFVSEDDLWNAEYDEDDTVRFPTWEVILTRLPHADEMLSLHAAGEPLYVSATWPGFPDEEYQTGPIPPRGTFLPGPIWRYERLHTDDGDWDED
jgi:hypothetical protein